MLLSGFFFKVFEWLPKVSSSLSSWLILPSVPKLSSSCSTSRSVWKVTPEKLHFFLTKGSHFISPLLKLANCTLSLGSHSLKTCKMLCRVCSMFSLLEILVYDWFFSLFWILKCTLNFATSVSFLLAPLIWLFVSMVSVSRVQVITCLPSPRAAVRSLIFHTHSSRLLFFF